MNHILNAGRIIGKSEKTPPLFQYAPIAYHGRAGTIVVSGTPIQRPSGYVFGPSRPSDHPAGPSVIYTQSKAMDYELELAAVIGKPLPMGEVLKATEADEHIFGFAVLNDWSGESFCFRTDTFRFG
jgi:fumarylacetoacetase